ncbi:unnamed protein product [marine sediment metagenome]|uniref:Protein export membrane protein SecD/SecF C-terminal domain-containing protein n=1 Tax=marine sediment metagenome TaxID=412755 RepID=X0Z081_9ZZZZ
MNFDFIAKKRILFMLSAIIIVLGLISFLLRWGLDFGKDFKEGTLIEVNFKEPIEIKEIRNILKKNNFTADVIQSMDEKKYQIELFTGEDKKDEIKNLFIETGLIKGDIKVNNILPFHSKDIFVKILYLILIGTVMLFLISLIKKEFILALVAFMTAIFNLLLTLSIFSILGKKISITMTISIIIIFIYSIGLILNIINRISKNKLLIKSIGYKKMINLSLKQASGVSSVALIAVLISLIGLIIYSEGLFRNLAILLTSGFIVITFSSIFTSGYLLEILNQYFSKYK